MEIGVNESVDLERSSLSNFLLRLRPLVRHNEMVVCLLSVPANIILMVLLVTERNKVLRPYANVLLQNCVVDIIFTLIFFILQPQFEFNGGYIYAEFSPLFERLFGGWHYVGIWAYVSAFTLSDSVVILIFYFRYSLVVRGIVVPTRRLFGMMCLMTVASSLQGVFSSFGFYSMDESRVEACRQIQPLSIGNSGTCIYTNIESSTSRAFFLMQVIIVVALNSLIFFWTYQVVRSLRRFCVNVSQKTALLQRQMNLLMFVQIISFIVSVNVPVITISLSSTFQVHAVGVGVPVSIMLSWMPLISPFSTIILVSNFRHRLLGGVAGRASTTTSAAATADCQINPNDSNIAEQMSQC